MPVIKYTLALILSGIILSLLPALSAAQNAGLPVNHLFGRKYKLGETYRYKLTMQEFHDGKWQFTNVVICELKVVPDSAGVPYDEVHWVSKKVINPKDTVDQTKEAASVTPYRISLDGKGKVPLPAIAVTEMTEPIQDFNTFFVAVSPVLGSIDKLNKTGDSIVLKDPVTANFANGTSMLTGEDCLAISARLISATKKDVLLHTAFMAPSQPCLTYISSEMNTPVVKDTLNNFQMVTPAANDLYNVNYGREYFYINSTIRKSDGKIIKADMFNQLNLKIKINCKKDYTGCQFEVPFAEQRLLTLELL